MSRHLKPDVEFYPLHVGNPTSVSITHRRGQRHPGLAVAPSMYVTLYSVFRRNWHTILKVRVRIRVSKVRFRIRVSRPRVMVSRIRPTV